MLTLSYLKDVENVVYGPEKEIVPQLAADLLIPNLDEAVEGFRRSPVKEGLILKGGRRSSVKPTQAARRRISSSTPSTGEGCRSRK